MATSLIQAYVSAFIGTGIEVVAFILFYSYFAHLPINWIYVLVFMFLYALVMGPLIYISRGRADATSLLR